MRAVGRWLALTLVLAVSCGVVGLVGTALGATRYDASAAILLRTILTLLCLVTVVVSAMIRWPEPGWAFLLSAATAAYLLLPLTWSGAALLARFATGNPLACLLIDLVVWLSATAGAVGVQVRRSPRRREMVEPW